MDLTATGAMVAKDENEFSKLSRKKLGLLINFNEVSLKHGIKWLGNNL